jgi:hypothetical protein
MESMFPEKMKRAIGSAVVLAALIGSAGALANPVPRSDKQAAAKPPDDLEALRKRITQLEIDLKNVLEKVRVQEAEIRKLQAKLDAVGKSAKEATKEGNPPRGDLEGIVRRVDSSGLVTISIGSDAGLQKGHTLEVYRMGKNPRYLGRIKIVDVSANQAVGKAVGRMTAPVQSGDHVASRVAPK